MDDPGNVASSQHPSQPGKKPHQEPHPGDHGPDPDEPIDKTESGEEP